MAETTSPQDPSEQPEKSAQSEQTEQSSASAAAPTSPTKAVFRIPRTAYLAIIVLIVCIIPIAFSGIPGLQALYLIPLGLLWFVARTKTVVTPTELSVYTMFGHRKLPWASLRGLALTNKGRVRAALIEGGEVTLPAVRIRHLPVLSLISGGRLPDPSGLVDELAQQTKKTTADDTNPVKE